MSERLDPWSLVQAKCYAEAADAYSRQFAEGGGTCALSGRAKALLLADKVGEALEDYRRIIESTEPRLRNDSALINLGICHWYLGQAKQAVCAWRESLSAPYSDAAGGVVPPAILLYAAVRLQDSDLESEALRLLRGHWQKHQRRVRRGQPKNARQAHEDFVHPGLYSWPGAIVPFLLNKIGEEEFDQAAKNTTVDILRSRWQCQADFFAAVHALREDNPSIFRDRMARCASSPYGELEDEFCLARWEVATGFLTLPFADQIAEPKVAPDCGGIT